MDRVQRPPMISVTAREESEAAALAVARCVAHAREEEEESSLPRQTSLLPGEVRTPSTMVTLADWAAPGSSIWFDEAESNAANNNAMASMNNAAAANSNGGGNVNGSVDGLRRSTHQSPLAAYNAASDVWGDGSALLGEDDTANERGTAAAAAAGMMMMHANSHNNMPAHGTAHGGMAMVDEAVAAKAAATLHALGPHDLPTPPLQPQPAPSMSSAAAAGRSSAPGSYAAAAQSTGGNEGYGANMAPYQTSMHAFPAAPMPQSYAMQHSMQGLYREGDNQRQTSTAGSHFSSGNENNISSNSNAAAGATSFFTVQEGRQRQQQEEEAAERQAKEQQMLRAEALAGGQAYVSHPSSAHGSSVSLTPGVYGGGGNNNGSAAVGGGGGVPMSVSAFMHYGAQVQQQQQQSAAAAAAALMPGGGAMMPSQYTPSQPYVVPTSPPSSHGAERMEARRGGYRAPFAAAGGAEGGSEAYAYPPTAAGPALQPPPSSAAMLSGPVSPLSGGGGAMGVAAYEAQGMMPMYGAMPGSSGNSSFVPQPQQQQHLPPPPPPMVYDDGWQSQEAMMMMSPGPNEAGGAGWPMSAAAAAGGGGGAGCYGNVSNGGGGGGSAYYNSGNVPGIYPVVPPLAAQLAHAARPLGSVDGDSVGQGREGYAAAAANGGAMRPAGSERMMAMAPQLGGSGGSYAGVVAEAAAGAPRVKTAGERVHEVLYFIANYFPPPPPPKVPAEDRRSRAELWYHYATIWDLTHRLPPPPRTPLPEMELEQKLRLQELTRTPYRGDGWLKMSDHWFAVVQRLFDYPEDNRGSRVDPQFVLQHAVTA